MRARPQGYAKVAIAGERENAFRQRFTVTGWNRKAATVLFEDASDLHVHHPGVRASARFGEDASERLAQEVQALPYGNAAIEQEGPDLVDGGSALAHQARTNRCSACWSTGSHINQLVHNSLGDRLGCRCTLQLLSSRV